MARLWEKGIKTDKSVLEFTAGNDYLLDERLVKYDCIASIAHAKMLRKAGIISPSEEKGIINGLKEIITLAKKGKFRILPEEEDCHTAIENYLVKKLGDAGKKVHTARSRNDQVLTALRLYYKDEIDLILHLVAKTDEALKKFASKYGNVRIPGYTHTRKAMPYTLKMWAGCFREALKDDARMLKAVKKLIDQSPLGTGAGFGIPVIKTDRKFTQKLLGFARLQKNPVYAQESRGKFEAEVVSVLSMIAYDINKLSSDVILFSSGELKIFEIPSEFTTGSSVMPQKKNPDVFEVARASYAKIVSLEMRLKMLPVNLITGYHRDLQLTKEAVFEAFDAMKAVLTVISKVLSHLQADKKFAESLLTNELFATEKAYKLVLNGKPFRDAYRKVAKEFSDEKQRSEQRG